MSLPVTLVEGTLLSVTGKAHRVKLYNDVSGGCINACYKVVTDSDTFFVKVNDTKRYPDMCKLEAMGLLKLEEAVAGSTPAVIGFADDDEKQILVMEWVETEGSNKGNWDQLGEMLADIHRQSDAQFGYTTDNYMGSLPQLNDRYDSFTDFFVQCRIDPMLKQSIDSGKLDRSASAQFQQIAGKLESLIPAEEPSLVHGDLWSGNFMFRADLSPLFIDPAIAYSHREADLAMTRLFGGFDAAFYRSYMSRHPTEPGWEDRIDLFNLYPLLVHVILFGGGYTRQVDNILRKYS